MSVWIGEKAPARIADIHEKTLGMIVTTNQPPFGVIIANLGTPTEPTPKAVRQYLAEFLWDRRVVDTPRPLWWLILHGVILRIRPGPVSKSYKSVWTEEGSPLMAISRRQQHALKATLDEQFKADIPVELAMTYGHPTIAEAGQQMRKAGVENIIVLPLYPQNSSSTTAAVYDQLARSLTQCPHIPNLRFINQYHVHEGYISALAQSVRDYWDKHGRGEKLLMSFHGIPQRYENKGDPYPRQCRATAAALAAKLELNESQWQCTFQSRFGREEWVKPYTDYLLKEWGQQGVNRVDVISPAFSADCLETLEELEVENRDYFLEAGGKSYHYIPCLNDRPDHIEMMKDIIIQNSLGWVSTQ